MYLSCLLINVGSNPDRPRPGRLWLRNLYRVHQRLCMAFPSEAQLEKDPEFLKPYHPSGFDDALLQCFVHIPRDTEHNFLYRIDPKGGGSVAILVQSALPPDWCYAFHNAEHLLAAPPQVKSIEFSFKTDEHLRFRLLANPVRKVSKKSLDFSGKPFDEKWIGKDVPVPTASLNTWLERRAEPGWSAQNNSKGSQSSPGFRVIDLLDIQAGYVYVNKNKRKEDGSQVRSAEGKELKDATGTNKKKGDGRRIRSARYEGVLQVTDTTNFRNTLIRGIGPGKAFGFGLLSVAPV